MVQISEWKKDERRRSSRCTAIRTLSHAEGRIAPHRPEEDHCPPHWSCRNRPLILHETSNPAGRRVGHRLTSDQFVQIGIEITGAEEELFQVRDIQHRFTSFEAQFELSPISIEF